MRLRRVATCALVSAACAATGCAGGGPAQHATGSVARAPHAARASAAAAQATATFPAGSFAYATIGSTVVATAYRVPRATRGQGPVTVVRFEPAHTRLVLHAGSAEPAPGMTWRHGPVIRRRERTLLVAAFNGGFKMRDARGGWMSEGRTIVPLIRGAGSIVIYADGAVDVGAWGREVPAPGRRVASVRQNLQLLIDRGQARMIHPPDQATLDRWWGHAFLEQRLISRSGLGVTAGGSLVWAAGTNVTVGALAHALLHAGAVRAIELDINAPLVRGFLFAGVAVLHTHSRAARSVFPLIAGQRQLLHDPALRHKNIAPHCTYLVPCSRDFFTVLTR